METKKKNFFFFFFFFDIVSNVGKLTSKSFTFLKGYLHILHELAVWFYNRKEAKALCPFTQAISHDVNVTVLIPFKLVDSLWLLFLWLQEKQKHSLKLPKIYTTEIITFANLCGILTKQLFYPKIIFYQLSALPAEEKLNLPPSARTRALSFKFQHYQSTTHNWFAIAFKGELNEI